MQARRPVEEDRLPWLEPYRETRKPGKPLPRRGFGKPLAIGAALGVMVAMGAGGYWLGQRSDQPAETRSSQTVALPPPVAAPPAPAPVQVAEAPPATPEPVAEQAPPPPPAKVAKPKRIKKAVHKRAASRKKIRTAGIQRARLDAVRAAQERQALRRPWPKMPSPGPAGQVIQLGAFSTPARANAAYSARIARYPMLGRMPRVVVPVVTKPSGRILYVLRLGTTSRQQSKTVCRNLRVSGDHCLVIG
jgi:hypothetical protein